MDTLSPEKRSWTMSRVKGKDTQVEILVRKYLFSKGFRFRKNDKRLPGKPDIVLPKFKTVVFVHGCFWHKHNCAHFKWPSTNEEYWRHKITNNVNRDIQNTLKLKADGWKVLVVWECEAKKDFQATMEKLEQEVKEDKADAKNN